MSEIEGHHPRLDRIAELSADIVSDAETISLSDAHTDNS